MKLSELKRIVDQAMQMPRAEDREVAVHMSEPGIPHAPLVKVMAAGNGFDWTAGWFIIHPEVPVVRNSYHLAQKKGKAHGR